MKSFKNVMGIFGVLLVLAASVSSQAFACVTEAGADSVEGGRVEAPAPSSGSPATVDAPPAE